MKNAKYLISLMSLVLATFAPAIFAQEGDDMREYIEKTCKQSERRMGGWNNAPIDNHIFLVTLLALDDISNEATYSLEIACAKQQVVAGTNYEVYLVADDSLYRVSAFRSLQGDIDESKVRIRKVMSSSK